MIRQFSLITLITFLLLVLGCSGGDGGDNKENMPPSADAGLDQTVEEQLFVSLTGSGSTDSDGTITNYLWSQLIGPATTLNNADRATAAFTAPTLTEEAVLIFRLTVMDNDGDSASDEVTVTVKPANSLPRAHAGFDQFVIGQTLVTLSGSGSDTDGPAVSYVWTQVEGTAVIVSNANTATAAFTAPSKTDLLTFRLTVIDNEGASASDDVTISVAAVIFFDDFEDGNADNWKSEDDSGILSDWIVISNEYLQQIDVQDITKGATAYVESYHRGTYSYLYDVEIDSKTSYRFSADITPLPNDDNDMCAGNDIGVMFRYQDIDNYYRLTLNSRYGFGRLEKRVGGAFSTLSVDSAGYYEGETLNVTVELNGSVIQVFLNDDPLFSVSDSSLGNGTIALYCQDRAKFDNVLVTDNSLAPSIVISSPVAYYIATTHTDTLDVSAIATNLPSGAEVEFVLDDTTSMIDSSSPYTARFSGVLQGEHTVDAILYDGLGSELARDTNVQIGVLGGYCVAVGDSITNGFADDDPSDNRSQDGRIIAIQGYEANLNDLLTSTLNYPHIVFNEGIGGDTSAQALGRIDSILERHPGSNKVLILLGTNDANSEVIPFEFRNNMQDLINMVPEGKEIWVALVPPVFEIDGTFNPDSTGNQLILQYNAVIVNELKGVQPLHPDFFEFFKTRPSLFADELHPNGLGYEAMAYLWHNELNEDNQLALPPYLENP
jgi:lysophospholipase L1-like esterase